MSAFKTTASALSIATLAAPALADVTAQQVWENWQGMLAIYGEGLTVGSETAGDGSLTVSDIQLNVEDGTDTVSATISEVVFTENGDGTVTVTMSEENPLSFTSEGVTVPLTIRSEDMEMVVSGTPEVMNYALTATRYGIEAVPGTYDEVTVNSGSLFLEDISGAYTAVMGETQDLDYTLNAAAIVAAVDMNEPGGEGTIVFNGQIDGLEAMVDASLPADMATMENPDAMFVEGFTMDASYEFGASQYDFSMNAEGQEGSGSASAAGGSMAITMSRDGVNYAGGAQQPRVSLTGFQIPFPVEVAMEEYSYDFEVPLSRSEEARDVGLAVALRGLTVNDMVWSMFDPGQMLPRDPATVAIDITGQVRPLFDFLDPAQQMEAAMSDMPAEIESMELNELVVSVAGAEVTGEGSFTFDNTDTTTFPGVPRPEGQLTLQASGINGLIDTLIQMGLVPQEQAMGARMMLGLFATPVGDDQLESVIEVNEQGHVLANGQRLQ